METGEILKHVDHTALKAFCTWADIQKLCGEAITYGMASVCVPPCYIRRIHDTYGEKLNICTVIGFPLGYSTTASKVQEARDAVADGASEIDMVINLEQWKDGAMYDRLGLENLYTTILDVQVPSLTVPVRPGRNLAVIIEVAAMNNRHKKMGYNAAVEFTKQINQHFDQAMSAQLNDN